MAVEHLFTQALGLASPWKVVSCDFDPAAKSLELVIDFERGSRFADPETGEDCPVHDTVRRSWEHLRFFEHRTTIHARVPRIKTPSGAVKTVEVPWAKPHSGFTLLMEAWLLAMAKVLPVAEVSRQTSVSEDRIWHLIRTRVEEAWKQQDWSSLERLAADETSTRKGHKYGTVFLEIEGKETSRGRGAAKAARLLFFTPGKDADTFTQFAAELERRGVPADQITEIAMDMSRAFIAGAAEHFPDAQICFDRFHVMKLCGEAIDQVRKETARNCGGLPRGAMWALRGNPRKPQAGTTSTPRADLSRAPPDRPRSLHQGVPRRHVELPAHRRRRRTSPRRHLLVLAFALATLRQARANPPKAPRRHTRILQKLHHFRRHRSSQRLASTRAPPRPRLQNIP